MRVGEGSLLQALASQIIIGPTHQERGVVALHDLPRPPPAQCVKEKHDPIREGPGQGGEDGLAQGLGGRARGVPASEARAGVRVWGEAA